MLRCQQSDISFSGYCYNFKVINILPHNCAVYDVARMTDESDYIY